MPADRESTEIKKAMAYDLMEIIEANKEKKEYAPEEIRVLIRAYIAGLTQK